MKKIKLSIAAFLASAAIFLAASTALASEGTAELTSTTGSESRCFISSVLMKNSNFKIIVSCRDLIYPPATNLFSYILWANPTEEGGKVIKLGELGVGKAEFNSNKAFSSLFVTSEVNEGARSASEKVVMRGNVQPISFLEKPTKQPTVTQEEVPETEEQKDPISTRERLLSGLKRAGLISLVGLATLIGLVFFVTKSRS